MRFRSFCGRVRHGGTICPRSASERRRIRHSRHDVGTLLSLPLLGISAREVATSTRFANGRLTVGRFALALPCAGGARPYPKMRRLGRYISRLGCIATLDAD